METLGAGDFVLSEADDKRSYPKALLSAWQTVWSGIEIYGSIEKY